LRSLVSALALFLRSLLHHPLCSFCVAFSCVAFSCVAFSCVAFSCVAFSLAARAPHDTLFSFYQAWRNRILSGIILRIQRKGYKACCSRTRMIQFKRIFKSRRSSHSRIFGRLRIGRSIRCKGLVYNTWRVSSRVFSLNNIIRYNIIRYNIMRKLCSRWVIRFVGCSRCCLCSQRPRSSPRSSPRRLMASIPAGSMGWMAWIGWMAWMAFMGRAVKLGWKSR